VPSVPAVGFFVGCRFLVLCLVASGRVAVAPRLPAVAGGGPRDRAPQEAVSRFFWPARCRAPVAGSCRRRAALSRPARKKTSNSSFEVSNFEVSNFLKTFKAAIAP